MQHMQHPLAIQLPSSSRLSEEDGIRIALKMKQVLEDEISQLVEQQVALKTQSLTQEVADLRQDLTKVQNELRNVSMRNDDLEQYSRRSCLRISGIKEIQNEDTKQLVLNLAGEVGADISIDDMGLIA